MKKALFTLLAFMLFAATPALAKSVEINENESDPSYLFIQMAKYGSLKPVEGKSGLYQLELQSVNEYLHYFSDRPTRITGIYPISKFVSQWNDDQSENSFNKMPPNVDISAIEVHQGKSKMINIVLELSAPSYNSEKGTLTYFAKIVPGGENHPEMQHLKHVVLFMDSYCASCVGRGF